MRATGYYIQNWNINTHQNKGKITQNSTAKDGKVYTGD